MKNKHFTKSDDSFKLEYCASVVRIGELKPIEGSDFLAKTLVNGFSIVVRKDEFTEGELAFYAPIETQLNEDFLKANNLFDNRSYVDFGNVQQPGLWVVTGLKIYLHSRR